MIRMKPMWWLAGLSLASLGVMGTANAACSIDPNSFRSVSKPQQQSIPTGRLTPAVFNPEALGGDFGTVIWHEDGTEIMISAARDPAAGDVCGDLEADGSLYL